mgnify:CR=1 FL=1
MTKKYGITLQAAIILSLLIASFASIATFYSGIGSAEIKKEILHCEATYFRLSWAELVNTLHKDQVPLEKVKELAGKVLSKSPLKLNHEDNLYQMIWYANRMYSDPSDPITNENASAERASCVANALNM